MSATTCARSGGAVLYVAAADRFIAHDLLRMQQDMDRIASREIRLGQRTRFHQHLYLPKGER